MPRRTTSLINIGDLAVQRLLDSKYDVVKAVSAYLADIETIAAQDIPAIAQALQDALDFTNFTVVPGAVPSWDPINKVLTVPTVKGDTGATGPAGADGANGTNGTNGLTPQVEFSVDVNGNLLYNVTYV